MQSERVLLLVLVLGERDGFLADDGVGQREKLRASDHSEAGVRAAAAAAVAAAWGRRQWIPSLPRLA